MNQTMKCNHFRLINLTGLAICFIFSSCLQNVFTGASSTYCEPPDSQVRPDWIRQTPDCDDTVCFFLGLSGEKHVSERDSWEHARISALNTAIVSIGIQFKLDDELLKKAENQFSSQAIDPTVNWESYQAQKAQALIRSVKNRSRYTELMGDCVAGVVKGRFYKTFELIVIEKSALKEAEEWQKNNRIQQFVQQANQLEGDSEYGQAIRKLQQAKTELQLDPIPAIQSWFDVIDGSIERLQAEAENQVMEARNLYELAKQRRLEGAVLESLELINQAKSKLRRSQFEYAGKEVISFHSLVVEEESIINDLFLQPGDNETRIIEPLQPVPELSLQVFLRNGKINLPVKDFPISFNLQTTKSDFLTDSEGKVRFQPPVFKEAGRYRISVIPDPERLKGILSPQAADLLNKKEVPFVLVVKIRTDDERAALLVSRLKEQLNRGDHKSAKFHLTIGEVHHGNQICEIPQLEGIQKAIRKQLEIQTDYTIHNGVNTPDTFPDNLDPFNASDQAKALGINILSYRFYQENSHLTLNANLFGPEGLLGQAAIWFGDRLISQEMIDESCYIPQLATWIDPITKMRFRLVKGGCFNMGRNNSDSDKNEYPVHEVCLNDFYLGTHEVTQEQWRTVIKSTPSRWTQGGSYPVERVSWNDAMAFVHTLNQKSNLRFDLPTEAEWEFACRGGHKSSAQFGTQSGTINRSEANYGLDSGFGPDPGDGHMATSPTGNYPPNKPGLYDMSGNVMEWVKDSYLPDGYRLHERSDPVVLTQGESKVLRGGSYYTSWNWLSCARRYHGSPRKSMIDAGFRLKMIK
jgi:formylglycine-generating enzyme required for sulfatase activity